MNKKIKNLFAITISLTMISSTTAFALESYTTPAEHTSSTNSTPVEVTSESNSATENVSCDCNQNNDEEATGSEANTTAEPERKPTYEEQHSQSANSTITVAGTEVKTSIAGVYAANSIRGCAIITSYSDVKTSLNLSDDQNPNIVIYDVNETQSSAAMASVNAVVEFIGGGDIVTSIYIDLCAKEGDKKVELSDGSVNMSVGLPNGADVSKDYVVICVQSGGIFEILDDQDVNQDTVTFEVQAGIGTYAFVAR